MLEEGELTPGDELSPADSSAGREFEHRQWLASQGFPIAENECEHGHLSHDRPPHRCTCFCTCSGPSLTEALNAAVHTAVTRNKEEHLTTPILPNWFDQLFGDGATADAAASDAEMVVVEIQDPADGRVSFEVGPFPSEELAETWRVGIIADLELDPDFVEVRTVVHKVYDPASADDMDEIREFYS